MEAKEIAIRIYENKKFGTTYGKGLFHSAVFNGAADMLAGNTKYLLDYYPFEKFEHIARTEEQMEILREMGHVKADDVLFSWVVRYDPATKEKRPVYGFSYFNMKDKTVALLAHDDADGECQQWQLTAKSCRSVPGKKSPSFLATNADDLGLW
jgi:hypothetical protein